MNTELITTPSPELKQHARDLRKDAQNVAQDVKNQASAGFKEIKQEADARLQEAKGTASDLFDSAKNFARENPFTFFGIGVVTGIVLTNWSRR